MAELMGKFLVWHLVEGLTDVKNGYVSGDLFQHQKVCKRQSKSRLVEGHRLVTVGFSITGV